MILLLVHLVHVERWIGHHEVELADAFVQVFVVAVPLPDVAGKGVDGEVHQAQMPGFVHPLLAVDRNLYAGIVLVSLDEVGTLDEHAARTARRVEDASVVRLDDFDDQLDQRGGREELAALLALGTGEVAEEVFVNLAESVPFGIHRNLRERLQQGDEGGVLDLVVGLGENALQFLVLGLDRLHRLVDGLADVLAFGQVQQLREPGLRAAGT